ncbi:phosphoribosyltransferase-like protein [Limtongia smithiae]|uniref:phosphoribosyltransferase-like protein n=1 Tax=Limtongia smithiae TaxID=1125753 RepID=UPI0034D010ED
MADATVDELKALVKGALRQYPDFPEKGILFEDILPIFQSPTTFQALLTAMALQIKANFAGNDGPEVIVGLDARGFLFGPTLALQLGAAFVPVRKSGKLPGAVAEAEFQKEYGTDVFAIQADAIKPGQRVVVVDDIIATGGSAKAAGDLVKQLGGVILEYVFILELDFLHGRDLLDAPVYTLLSGQPTKLE